MKGLLAQEMIYCSPPFTPSSPGVYSSYATPAHVLSSKLSLRTFSCQVKRQNFGVMLPVRSFSGDGGGGWREGGVVE